MSDKIKKKVEESFTDSILVKKKIADQNIYQVLLQPGGIISNSITTSGNSKNILEVLKEARNRGIFTLGFLGNGGGEALSYCDSAFVVPSEVTARIQESHITAGHALLQYVEDKLLEDGWLIKT